MNIIHILGTILDLLFMCKSIKGYELLWEDNMIDWAVQTNNDRYVGGLFDPNEEMNIEDLRHIINMGISEQDPDFRPPCMNNLMGTEPVDAECTDEEE